MLRWSVEPSSCWHSAVLPRHWRGTAWWLIRLRPSAFQQTRGLALGLALAFVIRILRGEGSVADWLIVVAAVAMAGYLTLSPVRALFRQAGD
jgi:hypothetical protein